jgi:hypothetical protein
MIPILIPPVPHLATIAGSRMHLVLSHMLGNAAYQTFYTQERREGAYLILDNGAHEHSYGEPIEDLIQKCALIGAQELVVPDVLFNASGTLESAVRSFRWFETHLTQVEDAWYPTLMIVPQGATREDFVMCLDRLLEAFGGFLARADPYRPRLVIGLSKDYEVFAGGLYSLLADEVIPAAKDFRAHIHLLGWGRNLWEYRAIINDLGDHLRSMDTAKPYVYAAHGIRLDMRNPAPVYPKRSPTYFDDALNDQITLVFKNVRVFMDMVYGTGGTR